MFINLCFFISVIFAQPLPGGPGQAGSGQNDAGSMTLDGNLNIRECNSPCCTDFYDDADVAIESNIKYGSAFHLDGTTPYELFLDTYEVKQRNAADPFKNTKKPVAVFVHGGGFSPDSTKDGEQALEACTAFAKRGFVCVSVEYRRWAGVSGATTLRVRNDPALDLQAALRYLVKEADNIGYDSANGFGIDAEQIVLYGGSAGGLTISSALLLDVEKVAAKTHEVDVANGNLGYPSSEFCSRNPTSVNCHCQFDPTRMHEDGCNSGNWGGLGIENVKGVIVNSGGIDIPQLDSGIESCMQRPYFGMHYDGDSRVNYNKATTAKSLLDRSNTPNALLTAPGNSHVLRMFEVAGYANSILFDDIYAFCLQQLDTTCGLSDGANVEPCVDVDQGKSFSFEAWESYCSFTEDSYRDFGTIEGSNPASEHECEEFCSNWDECIAYSFWNYADRNPGHMCMAFKECNDLIPTTSSAEYVVTRSLIPLSEEEAVTDSPSTSPSSSPTSSPTTAPTTLPSSSPTSNNCPSGYDQVGTMTENNDIGGYGMAGSSPRIISTVEECATICDETEGCLSFTWGWGGNIRAFDANGAGRCIWYNRDTPNRDDGRNVLFCARLMATNVNPAPERFALIDGAPNGGRRVAEYANPDPTEKLGEVQCCQVDGQCTRRFPNTSDCLSGNNDASKFTLQEAVDMCKNLGAEWSLCTREQTNNDNCRGTGCQHDSALVWVADHI